MNNEPKTSLLTVKVSPSRLEEFRIAATLRGTTMSGLINQFIAMVVREEMAAVPRAFQRRGEHSNTELVDLIEASSESRTS